jgi:hypothetical protein
MKAWAPLSPVGRHHKGAGFWYCEINATNDAANQHAKMRDMHMDRDEGKMRGLRADTKRDIACFDD